MKSLYLIRHAKSSWEDVQRRDFDRPLSEEGHQEATTMATFLKNLNIEPEHLICSPALRTLTTCKHFADAFAYPTDQIIKQEKLYEASIDNLYDVIHRTDNQYNTVFIFGHNPSVSYFADIYLNDYLPEVATCGIVHFELNSQKWADFSPSKATFAAMWEPQKKLTPI
jgi:phosphohistidine phosphatase